MIVSVPCNILDIRCKFLNTFSHRYLLLITKQIEMIQFLFFSLVANNFSSDLLLVSDILVNDLNTAINLVFNAYIAI